MRAQQCPISEPLEWFFLPHPQVVSLQTWANLHAAEYTGWDLHRSPEFSLWVACFFSGSLPCEFQKPGLLGFSIPQLRHLQSSAWDPSQSHPLDTLKAAYWGNHRVYLICLPPFSDHWTLLTDVECLENHCLNYLSFCMCVLGSVVKSGQKWKS